MAAYARIFSDLYGDVISRLRMDTTLDLTKTKEALNQSLSQAAVESKFFTGSSAGAALTANATTQALPSAVIELEWIACSYGGLTPILTEASFQQLLAARGQGSSSGPPLWYSLRQSTVEFYPGAAGGEILTYYGAVYPDELSAAGDTIPLPEPYPNVLLYGALAQLAEFKKDPLLGEYQRLHSLWLNRFLAFSNRRKGAGPWSFRVRGVDGPAVFPNPSTDVPWQR